MRFTEVYKQWHAQHEQAVKPISGMAKLRGNFRMTMAPIKKPSPEELRARMDFMKGLDIRGYLAAHPESKQTYESMMAKIQKVCDIFGTGIRTHGRTHFRKSE